MTFTYENKKIEQGFSFVVGCDEVGRGCLAGPVVSAAVILKPLGRNDKLQVESYKVIKDSKKLSSSQRDEADSIIRQYALAWGIGEVSEKEIDTINIHHASLLAMKKAIQNLFSAYSHELALGRVFVTVDGKFSVPGLEFQQEAVVGGDNKILSIAAASVVAKVYRDNLMKKIHVKFPKYGFADHKGYATFHHRQALRSHGLTPLHRISFCGNYI